MKWRYRIASHRSACLSPSGDQESCHCAQPPAAAAVVDIRYRSSAAQNHSLPSEAGPGPRDQTKQNPKQKPKPKPKPKPTLDALPVAGRRRSLLLLRHRFPPLPLCSLSLSLSIPLVRRCCVCPLWPGRGRGGEDWGVGAFACSIRAGYADWVATGGEYSTTTTTTTTTTS